MTQDVEGKRDSYVIYPRRFRWLKRGAAGFLLLLVALAGARLAWDRSVESRFCEMAREARARGEPFYAEDFRQLPIPDDENAMAPLLTAADQLAKNKIVIPESLNDYPTQVAALDMPVIDELITRCHPELRLIRGARSRTKAVFAGAPTSHDLSHRLPHLYEYNDASHILALAALEQRAKGNDGEALQCIRDILFLEDALERADPSYLNALVAMGMSSRATSLTEQAAMDLQISENGSAATHDQVRELIAILLNEKNLQECAVQGCFLERMAVVYILKSRLDRDMNWINMPSFEADALSLAERDNSLAEGCQQADFQTAQKKFKPFREWYRVEGYVRPTYTRCGNPHRIVDEYFRALADRRGAATMLAIRLFAGEHQGKLPNTLAELVPGYLPAVPVDPFDPSRHTIQYAPQNNPPTLYSVGRDGKDDGGVWMQAPYWNDKDIIYCLVAQPRISPPRKPTTRRSTVPQK